MIFSFGWWLCSCFYLAWYRVRITLYGANRNAHKICWVSSNGHSLVFLIQCEYFHLCTIVNFDVFLFLRVRYNGTTIFSYKNVLLCALVSMHYAYCAFFSSSNGVILFYNRSICTVLLNSFDTAFVSGTYVRFCPIILKALLGPKTHFVDPNLIWSRWSLDINLNICVRRLIEYSYLRQPIVIRMYASIEKTYCPDFSFDSHVHFLVCDLLVNYVVFKKAKFILLGLFCLGLESDSFWLFWNSGRFFCGRLCLSFVKSCWCLH